MSNDNVTGLVAQAATQVARDNFAEAARLYREAAGACIGHSQRDWCEDRAEQCDRMVKNDQGATT